MRRVNGYNRSALKYTKIRDFRGSEILKSFARNKVSNLKMADYDKEIPFGDEVENRGVDDDDEIEMRNLNPYDSSSRRGSEDTTFRSSHSKTYEETSFNEGEDEHTPLITEEEKRDKAWAEIKRKFPKVDTTKFTAFIYEFDRVKVKCEKAENPHFYLNQMAK